MGIPIPSSIQVQLVGNRSLPNAFVQTDNVYLSINIAKIEFDTAFYFHSFPLYLVVYLLRWEVLLYLISVVFDNYFIFVISIPKLIWIKHVLSPKYTKILQNNVQTADKTSGALTIFLFLNFRNEFPGNRANKPKQDIYIQVVVTEIDDVITDRLYSPSGSLYLLERSNNETRK